MLLKKLVIENFGCFPGIHEITFSPTLTLIIGDNGDGKTTIFEALSALLQHQGNEQKIYLSVDFQKKPKGSFRMETLKKCLWSCSSNIKDKSSN